MNQQPQQATPNLHPNDHGGITYAAPQRVGVPENRCPDLACVRMTIDTLQELCAEVRRHWPERYPVPPEVDAILRFSDYALIRARSGSLKRLAEACAQ